MQSGIHRLDCKGSSLFQAAYEQHQEQYKQAASFRRLRTKASRSFQHQAFRKQLFPDRHRTLRFHLQTELRRWLSLSKPPERRHT